MPKLHLVRKLIILSSAILVGILAFSSRPHPVSAEIDNKINFQGKIVNLSNGTNVVTGTPACVKSGADTCDFRVRIWNHVTNTSETAGSGNLMYSETHQDVEIGANEGVFNLKINSCGSSTSGDSEWGTATSSGNAVCTVVDDSDAGSDPGVDFNRDDLYMEIGFAPADTSGSLGSFTELFTRKELTSVPYAFVARGLVDGVGGGDPIDADGIVQIQPDSVQTANDSTENIVTTVDNTGTITGQHTSIAIGSDGFPVISYRDGTGQDLEFVKCGNAACSSGNTLVTLDSTNAVGEYTSIAIGTDNFPVISYYDGTQSALMVVKCGNASCSAGNTITTVDNTSVNTGNYSSLAIGGDGFPVISYHDNSLSDLKFVKCGNAACSAGNTIVSIDTANSSGWFSSITVGTDGFPVISYQDGVQTSLKVVKCGNATCNAGNTITTIENDAGNTGQYTSIEIGSDGFPVISYYDLTNTNLKVAKCGDASCSTGNIITTFDDTGISTGTYSSITIGDNGFPVISYYDATGGDLEFIECGNLSCSSGNTFISLDTANDTGQYTSITIGDDGFPVISYYDITLTALKVVKCQHEGCFTGIPVIWLNETGVGTPDLINMQVGGVEKFVVENDGSITLAGNINPMNNPTSTTTTISQTIAHIDNTTSIGQYTSTAIGTDGLPVISFFDDSLTALKVVKCGNTACNTGNIITTVDNTGTSTGQNTSIAIGTDGFPVISYYDVSSADLEFVKCGNAACSLNNTLVSLDTTNNVGSWTSIAIGTDGFPIISYHDASQTSLKVVKCGNATCNAGNTLTTVDNTGTSTGLHTSIAIGSDGLPVISYVDNTSADLEFVKCGNATCSIGNTFTTLDSTNSVGTHTSMKIGSDGLPVISYYDATQSALMVLKCGNATCNAGNTITTVDNTGTNTGEYTSLAIGTDGFPVVSYYDATSFDLEFVKCGNLACSSGNSFTTLDDQDIVGLHTSIAIGSEGFPVISYFFSNSQDLRVLRCASAACSIEPITITTVDNTGTNTGQYTSTAIGSDGFPVISYQDGTGFDLEFVKCGNAACSSGNTLVTLDSTNVTGYYTSIAIGTDNFPVISYWDGTLTALMVLKCGNATCNAGNTITTVDNTGTDTGTFTSIAIGSDTFPVISYYDATGADLEFVKCGNAACSAGNTLVSLDTANSVGLYSSIAIGADNFPVISYYDGTNTALKVLKCGNASCNAGNTTTQVDNTGTQTGPHTSIAVPSDGLPVISYQDVTAGELKFVKCGNAACSSGNSLVYPITTVVADGAYTSIKIGSDGFAVISYYIDTASVDNLAFLKCGNATCNDGNSLRVVDTTNGVGQYSSVAIGVDDFPVISYYDSVLSALKFIKCTSIDCLTQGVVYAGEGQDIGSREKYFKDVFAVRYYGKSYNVNNFDVAEEYEVEDLSIEAGDVVRFSTQPSAISNQLLVERAQSTTEEYDSKVIGVVSTEPGLYLKNWEEEKSNGRPVALVGRVPVKVTDENGAIKRGDYLVASSTPGYAMKGTSGGYIVGRAMEDFGTDSEPQLIAATATESNEEQIIGDSELVQQEIEVKTEELEELLTDNEEIGKEEFNIAVAEYEEVIEMEVNEIPETLITVEDSDIDGPQQASNQPVSYGRIMMYVDLGFVDEETMKGERIEEALDIQEFKTINGEQLFNLETTENVDRLTINAEELIIGGAVNIGGNLAVLGEIRGKALNLEDLQILKDLKLDNSLRGVAVLQPGEAEVVVQNPKIKEDSIVYVLSNQYISYKIEEIKEGESFKIRLLESEDANIEENTITLEYLIIN